MLCRILQNLAESRIISDLLLDFPIYDEKYFFIIFTKNMEKNHSPVEFLFVKDRNHARPAPALEIRSFAREIPPFQRPAALFLHGVFRKTAVLTGIGIFRLRCFSQARMPRFPSLLLAGDGQFRYETPKN
jgi:hypothetical protein